MRTLVLWIAISVSAEDRKLAAVEFFGIAPGDNLEEIREALPVRPGDAMVPRRIGEWKEAARKAVRAVTMRETTDVGFVCCNDDGGWVIYIGLGNTPAAIGYRAKAAGDIRLPSQIMKFDRELNKIWINNVMAGAKGDGGALQKKLAALRVLAAKHEPLLRRVAAESSADDHRAAAAFALGHGLDPSEPRVAVLMAASNDGNEDVRNNAVRGLIDWAAQRPELIDPAVFLKLVQSGIWSDRNKGSVLRRMGATLVGDEEGCSDFASDPARPRGDCRTAGDRCVEMVRSCPPCPRDSGTRPIKQKGAWAACKAHAPFGKFT